VKIWYDVSDLVGWKLPHLTGIQRTTVGILNGLMEQDDSVGLVRYNAKAGRFSVISASELPANVRCHLRGFAAAESDTSSAESARPGPLQAAKTAARPGRRKLKLFKKGFFFGGPGETEEMRNAFRQFKTAARQLRKSIGHWAKRRLRRAARPGQPLAPPPHMRGAAGHGMPAVAGQDVAAFAAPGDALVSIGAT